MSLTIGPGGKLTIGSGENPVVLTSSGGAFHMESGNGQESFLLPSIADALVEIENVSVFRGLMNADSNIAPRLSSESDETIFFIPTNTAMNTKAALDNVQLSEVNISINLHTLPIKRLTASGVQSTLSIGDELQVFVNGDEIRANGARVIKSVKCSNGMVCVIDHVLKATTDPTFDMGPTLLTKESADYRLANTAAQYEMVEILKTPQTLWGIDELSSGLLVATFQNDHMLRVVSKVDGSNVAELDLTQHFSNLYAANQAGALGIKAHTDSTGNTFVYFHEVTHPDLTESLKSEFVLGNSDTIPQTEAGAVGSRSVVCKVSVTVNSDTDVAFGTPSIIYEASPYVKYADAPYASETIDAYHYGGGIEIANNRLYVAFGERFEEPRRAQSLEDTHGTVCCLELDGTPVDMGVSTVCPEIMSYGHRNPQGLCYVPEQNALLATEHGALGGDEVNVIRVGKNYGWPYVSDGKPYGNQITESAAAGLFVANNAKEYNALNADNPNAINPTDPMIYFYPSVAPRGIKYIRGDQYDLKGSILVCGVKFHHESFMKLDMTMGTPKMERMSVTVSPAVDDLKDGIGRVSNVIECADGTIYMCTQGFRPRAGNSYALDPSNLQAFGSSVDRANTSGIYKMVKV